MTDCPSPWHQEPVQGEPIWCRPCHTRIRRQLAALDTLIPLIEHGADGYGEATESTGIRGRAAHAPSPSPAGDDVFELEETLREWEHIYRRVKGWPSAERHGYQAQVTTEIVTWLGRHLNGILESDFAVEFGEEVARAHRELTVRSKAGTGRHIKPLPCPWCEYKTLVWYEGDSYIRCDNPQCRCRLKLQEYDDLVAAKAAS